MVVGNLSTISEYFVLIISSQIFSLSLAIIGIILAPFFYLKGKKEKKPTFQIRSFNLVKEFSQKVTNIELLYSGENVENLTITKVVFWNRGNEPIRKDDIAVADPIKIVVGSKYEIFEAEILNDAANEANRFELVKNGNKSIIITFDFILHGEGIAVQIAHSGLSSEDVTLTGTIIGAGKPEEIVYDPDQTHIERSYLTLTLVCLGLFVSGCIGYIDADNTTIAIQFILIIIFFFIYKFASHNHGFPKKFRSFISEEM